MHGLRLRAGKVEARLCDRNSGIEEGTLFLRLRRIALEQSCGVEKDAKEASSSNECPRTSLTRVSSCGGGRSSIATGGVLGVDGEGNGDEDTCGGSRSSGESSFSDNVTRVQGLPRSASWSVLSSASALASSEYRLGRRGNSIKSLARTRSARSIWDPQGGGVPPDLHLIPTQDFIENMASLREGSGDEVDGEGERRALAGGNDISFDELEKEEEVGDDVKGENEDDDIEVEGVPGRGKWDKELNAMTQAAWFGSKQASCRGFNSNASGSVSRDPPEEERMMISGDRDGVSNRRVSGRGRGLAPALPPRQREQPPPPPVSIYGDSSREAPAHASDSVGGYGARGISGDRAEQEREGEGGRKSGISEGRRVAGSDFLYRVMFDGLNVLVTLRVR